MKAVIGLRVSVVLLFSAAAAAAQPPSMTLAECYEAALKRSEAVGVQDELLYQANENSNQANGAVPPTLSGSATVLEQQSTGSAVFPTSQNTVKVSGDQPLFRGFREYAAIRQKKALTQMQKFALQDAARQLFYNLATAYYNVLALQSDMANYKTEIEINEKRLKELQGFMRIGRSRLTDVLTQQTQISALQATLESTIGQLEVAKEALAYVTGFGRDTPLKDDVVPPPQPDSVSIYLSKIEERPDVKQAAANVTAFEEGVPIAWGAHLPSVDILGDYYFDRPGLQSTSHWDVSLAVTMPIFQGGIIQSQIRQAVSIDRQYNLLLSQARRTAEQEIRQFHDSFTADQRQYSKLGETAEISERNYQAEVKDYRNGLVTNLDVLTAITSWQDSVRTWTHQNYTAKSDFVKLQAASAERKEIYIESRKE